jgi:hypothetical protein
MVAVSFPAPPIPILLCGMELGLRVNFEGASYSGHGGYAACAEHLAVSNFRND